MKTLCKKLTAEFIGTALLVFLAVGAAILSGDIVVGALAFGLVIVAMVYSLGSISGGHFNPAVSFGLWIAKKMKAKDMAFYIIAQILGAIVGAALLFLIVRVGGFYQYYGAAEQVGIYHGANYFYGLAENWGLSMMLGLVIEIALTFVFVFTILMVTSKANKYEGFNGIIIGLTLTLVHLIGIPLTGTSVNPARSIGPAVFGGWEAFREVWLFIVAPLIGAALAAVVARCLLKGKTENVAEEVSVEE